MNDPSLAAQRTSLSWQRTGLTYMATGAAMLRLLPSTPWRLVLSASLIALGALASIGGRRLDPRRPHRAWLRGLTIATAIAALAAAALAS